MRYTHVILGSRSPRRRELLQQLVPQARIQICAPQTSAEAGFEGLEDLGAIETRLREIVNQKRLDVTSQLSATEHQHALGIVADTIVVVTRPNGSRVVLGQPPADQLQATVRTWFAEYYSGRQHEAWTGVCAWTNSETVCFELVKSTVTFRKISTAEIDWYLSTGESAGKAGGYALQGLASLFVTRVEGSLTNIIGLPLEILQPLLVDAI